MNFDGSSQLGKRSVLSLLRSPGVFLLPLDDFIVEGEYLEGYFCFLMLTL